MGKCHDCSNAARPGMGRCAACSDKEAARQRARRACETHETRTRDRERVMRRKRALGVKPKPPAKPPKPERTIIPCEVCTAMFMPVARNCAYCSPSCRAEMSRRAADRHYKAHRAPPRMEHACGQCGAVFIGSPRRVFCSRLCLKMHKDRAIPKNARKRARHYGVAYEVVNVLHVLERDGWRCQICGKDTPKARRGSRYPNAPELDHRVPMSKGGGHTYENVQCACRACNGAKGSASSAGQLGLFVRPAKAA